MPQVMQITREKPYLKKFLRKPWLVGSMVWGCCVWLLLISCGGSSLTQSLDIEHRCGNGPPPAMPASTSQSGDFSSMRQELIDCKTRTDTGYVQGKAFTITVVTVDGKPVERDTANAYWVMREAARKAGVSIVVVSGFRTMSEQQYLYNCYLTKKCNNGNLAAKPGYSNHQSGHALDLNTSSSGVLNWLNANGAKYGFKRTVSSEPWHWEWWGGGPGGGPCNPTCKAECITKSKMRGTDCGEGDCAAFGALCANDALGLRCYSVFCPALGTKQVCVNGELGSCKDGKLTLTKCSAGKTCVDTPQPRCAGTQPARGYLDAASCKGAQGWAQDPDAPDKAVDVRVSFGAKHGEPGALEATTKANQRREDLCSAINSCNHGFTQEPPLSLLDGKPHPVYAIGVDLDGVKDIALGSSPQTLQCKGTIPPGIRRHVIDPPSLVAWKFDLGWQALPVSDAEADAIPKGPDLAAKPTLVQADDGTPEVWIVDGDSRRHITSPAVMDAWKFVFGDVQKWPASKVYDLQKGRPWRSKPFLIRTESGSVDLIDTSPDAETTEEPVPIDPEITTPDGGSGSDDIANDAGNRTDTPNSTSDTSVSPTPDQAPPVDKESGVVVLIPTLPDPESPANSGCAGCSLQRSPTSFPLHMFWLFLGFGWILRRRK